MFYLNYLFYFKKIKFYGDKVKQIKLNLSAELKSLLSKLSNDEVEYLKKKVKMKKKIRLKKLRKFKIRKQKIVNKIPRKPPSAFSLFVNHLVKTNKLKFKVK